MQISMIKFNENFDFEACWNFEVSKSSKFKPQIFHGMVCHDGSRLHHEKQKDVKIVNDIK